MIRRHKISESERQALATYVVLMRAAESVTAALRPGLARMELTDSQFGVLEALYSLGPLCQRSLGEKILKTSGNITMVIDNLEKQDLVARNRSPEDRRMVMISLTEKGMHVIAHVFPVHAKNVLAEMSHITDAERTDLRRLCKKLGKRR